MIASVSSGKLIAKQNLGSTTVDLLNEKFWSWGLSKIFRSPPSACLSLRTIVLEKYLHGVGQSGEGKCGNRFCRYQRSVKA